MPKRKTPPKVSDVSTVVDGKRYVGTCSIQGNSMTVSYVTAGSKNANIGNSRPDILAELLLRELISEAPKIPES
jgi:hypothetical protein